MLVRMLSYLGDMFSSLLENKFESAKSQLSGVGSLWSLTFGGSGGILSLTVEARLACRIEEQKERDESRKQQQRTH